MSCLTPKLEVEDEENRQQRISNLLEHLNSSSSSNPPPHTFDFGVRKTFALDPPSELLARIQAFLPRIKAENDSLAQRIPSSVDIENIEEDAEQYIEMNLGLGVLEMRPKDSVSHRSQSDGEESESASEDDSSSSSSCDSTSSSESDSDSSSDSSMRIEAIASRPIKPFPRGTARFGIDILPDPSCTG